MSDERKHPDCEDRCQILEHKGYHDCTQTGRCELLAASPQGAQEGETPETNALRNKGHTTIEQWVVLCERLERRLRARDVAHSECPSEGCCIVGPDEDCPKLQNVAPQPHRDMAAPEPRMPASAAPEQRSAMPKMPKRYDIVSKLTRCELEETGIGSVVMYFDYSALRAHCAALAEQVERLRRQLPTEMQDCTIQFRECAKGHGWLTATNWVQHPCPTCSAEQADQRAGRMEKDAERYRWLRSRACRMPESIVVARTNVDRVDTTLADDELDAAIDAARSLIAPPAEKERR